MASDLQIEDKRAAYEVPLRDQYDLDQPCWVKKSLDRLVLAVAEENSKVIQITFTFDWKSLLSYSEDC